MYSDLPNFSASSSGSNVHREDKMAEALVDLANEMNFAPEEDNTEYTELIDHEASTFQAMFEELQSRLVAGCTKNVIIQFSC